MEIAIYSTNNTVPLSLDEYRVLVAQVNIEAERLGSRLSNKKYNKVQAHKALLFYWECEEKNLNLVNLCKEGIIKSYLFKEYPELLEEANYQLLKQEVPLSYELTPNTYVLDSGIKQYVWRKEQIK